jgi:hypothetical protein
MKRALYHMPRLLEVLGWKPTEVELLRYEDVQTVHGPMRVAVVMMPTSPDSIIGIACRKRGVPLPPPVERRVPAESIEEIGGEA